MYLVWEKYNNFVRRIEGKSIAYFIWIYKDNIR